MQPRRQATLRQPLQCDLQPEIPKHPITTHTQPHPKQLAATVTMRQKKKRQTDRSRNRRTHEVPFIVACSHFTRKNTRFRAPASSPKHSPCNIMQPLQCGSQHQLANLHLSTHRTTPEQQMTRVMQPFQCDLQPEIPKQPITTHTQPHPKQLQATVTLRQKKTTNRPQPQPSHARGTFHRRLQPLYTEKHKVSCSGFLPKTKPMQHHAAIPMRSETGDSKTASNYAHTTTPKAASSHRYAAAKKKTTNRPQPQPSHTRGTFHRRLQPLYTEKHKVSCSGFRPKHSPCNIMQPFQWDLQPQIPKHPINTHTQPHPKQLQATVTLRQKKKRQTDRSRNRRTDEVPFIAGCSHFTRKNTRFRAPASSPKHSPCNIMQPFQWDLQPQIPKHPINTHTQPHTKQLQATVTLRQKKTTNRP